MAGFFGLFDYTKPGPGIPKDAPPKARIIVFFEIFFRKFWNMVKINIMFNIFNLPAIIAALFVSQFFFRDYLIPVSAEDPETFLWELVTRFILVSVLLCIPVITVGPAQAGFTYLMRNYAREEHAFIWWDFKENAIKNFKESMIICVIDLVAIVMSGLAINFYLSFRGSNFLMSVASGIMLLSLVLFIMMHLYIYPMLVTFNLTVKQIYKNALLFSLIKFIPNLGIILLCTVLLFASMFFYPVIGLILYAFIMVSTLGLLTNFYVYPIIKKHMIEKVEEEAESEEETEGEEEAENEEETEGEEETGSEEEPEEDNR